MKIVLNYRTNIQSCLWAGVRATFVTGIAISQKFFVRAESRIAGKHQIGNDIAKQKKQHERKRYRVNISAISDIRF